MAIVGLSEFTFGYGFLYEQTRQHWGNLRIAPILPSLAQEANDAWDARLPLIGSDFYYQFKLSDYLERRNSLFHRDGTYTTPYYRIPFHRRENNRQHHRLWLHSQTNPQTYYVSPEFNSIDDFNNAFLARQLAGHSRLIPLNECDDCTDSEQHYITYQTGDIGWNQHSERKRRERSYRGSELAPLYESTRQSWRRIDEEFAEAAYLRATNAVKESFQQENMSDRGKLESVMPLLDEAARPQGRRETLERTAQILSVCTGATMVLVGEGAAADG